jgi:hypothetical protein
MTARTGMANLIAELRGMTEAGTADYTVGSSAYWDDDQMQNILDIHRKDIIFEPLKAYSTQIAGGSLDYRDYRSMFGFYEATTGGTAVFYVQDATGAVAGTANYTPDYRRGQVVFNSNQVGTIYYLTGRSYDLEAAAADIWRRKAAHYAPTAFNFSTDNHSISREQVYSHCLEMANYYAGQSATSITTTQFYRSDVA